MQLSDKLYSPAFIRARHIANNFTNESISSDMAYISLYRSFHYEPEEHKAIIEDLIVRRFNQLNPGYLHVQYK